MWILKEIKKFRKTGNLKHIYKKELGTACFAHDAAHSHSKDLVKRTISDKILNDKSLWNSYINLKYDGYERGLATMV